MVYPDLSVTESMGNNVMTWPSGAAVLTAAMFQAGILLWLQRCAGGVQSDYSKHRVEWTNQLRASHSPRCPHRLQNKKGGTRTISDADKVHSIPIF